MKIVSLLTMSFALVLNSPLAHAQDESTKCVPNNRGPVTELNVPSIKFEVIDVDGSTLKTAIPVEMSATVYKASAIMDGLTFGQGGNRPSEVSFKVTFKDGIYTTEAKTLKFETRMVKGKPYLDHMTYTSVVVNRGSRKDGILVGRNPGHLSVLDQYCLSDVEKNPRDVYQIQLSSLPVAVGTVSNVREEGDNITGQLTDESGKSTNFLANVYKGNMDKNDKSDLKQKLKDSSKSGRKVKMFYRQQGSDPTDKFQIRDVRAVDIEN